MNYQKNKNCGSVRLYLGVIGLLIKYHAFLGVHTSAFGREEEIGTERFEKIKLAAGLINQ